jgi:hypothetical protein
MTYGNLEPSAVQAVAAASQNICMIPAVNFLVPFPLIAQQPHAVLEAGMIRSRSSMLPKTSLLMCVPTKELTLDTMTLTKEPSSNSMQTQGRQL